LEEEFDTACMDSVEECRKLHYNPGYFLMMRAKDGIMATATPLLANPGFSDGFSRLWSVGRVDLTLEAIVWNNPKFWALFSAEIIKTVVIKLVKVGYIHA